jgi:uncharacterized protein YdaU (DUF1376 family)
MAKDPAFLFYPGDYISGTMYLDFECKGAYMDLLMLQFQKDHMTLHMIKHVLGHKFDHIWPLISDKFREENGKFWNERLKVEKDKRIKFTESRRSNRNNKKEENHMINHMENENENINTVVFKGGLRGKTKPEKAIEIDAEKMIAVFADGSTQELGQYQQMRLKEGNYQPHWITKGKIE